MNPHFLLLKKFLLCIIFFLHFNPDAFSQSIRGDFLKAEQKPSLYKIHNYQDSKEEFKFKNPTVAFLLSSGVTMGSVLTGSYMLEHGNSTHGAWILGLGIIIGPSAGNMYAQNNTSVANGISTRLLGGLTIAGGAYLGIASALSSAFGGESYPLVNAAAYTLLIGGAGIVLYSTMFDFINAPKNVEKYNAQESKFRLGPTYDPVHNSVGLSMNISF